MSSTLTSGASRVLTIAVSFITIPLTSSYLGAERFGLWMTLLSLSVFFAFADLGLGNGLINLVAESSAKQDDTVLNTYISSAYCVVGCIAAALLVVIAAVAISGTPAQLFGLSASSGEANRAIVLYALCAVVQLPVNLVQKIRVGLQQGYVNGIWSIGTSVLTIGALFAAIHARADLPTLVLAVCGSPVLISVIHSVLFWGRSGRRYIPQLSNVRWDSVKAMVMLGGMYFALQVIAAFATSADNVIIMSQKGAASVGDYAVSAKLFGLIGTAVALLLQPLWPMYSEAIASGDRSWAARIFLKVSIFTSVVSLMLGATLMLSFKSISHFWMGRSVDISMPLLAGFAAAALVDALSMCIATYLNGMRVLAPQIVSGVAVCVVGITVKKMLLSEIGLGALPWVASGVGVALFVVPMFMLAVRLSK